MSHEAIQELLSSYLDDDLSAEERQRVDEHLASCEACREELALLRLTVDALRDMPVLEAPGGFADAVMDRIEMDGRPAAAPAAGGEVVPLRRRTPKVLLFAPVALAAAACLVVGTVWWLVPRFMEQEPQVFASRSDAAAEAETAMPAAEPGRSTMGTGSVEKSEHEGDAVADLEAAPAPDMARSREMREEANAQEEPAASGAPGFVGEPLSGGLAGTGEGDALTGLGSTGARTRGGGADESKDGTFTPWETTGVDMDALADAPAPPAAGWTEGGAGRLALDSDAGDMGEYAGAENERRIGESRDDDDRYYRRAEQDRAAAAPEDTADGPVPIGTARPATGAEILISDEDAVADTEARYEAEMEDDFDAAFGAADDGDYADYDDYDEEEEAESVSLRRGATRDRDQRRSRADQVSRTSGRSADKPDRGGAGAAKAKKSVAEAPAEAPLAEREITPEAVDDEMAAGADASAVAQTTSTAAASKEAEAGGRASWVLQTSNPDALVRLGGLCDASDRIRCSWISPNRSPIEMGGEGIDQTVTIHVTRDAYDGWKRDVSTFGSLNVREQVVDGLASSDTIVLQLTVQFRP